LDQGLLTVAGVCGAAMLGAQRIAFQLNWMQVDDPRMMATTVAGAGLMGTSLFAQWSTSLCLLAAVWIAVSLFGLGRTLIR
jgi:hypothetical protein